MELSFGRSILPRKWVAKMTKMAVLAKMDKNDPKGLVFYNFKISDFWAPDAHQSASPMMMRKHPHHSCPSGTQQVRPCPVARTHHGDDSLRRLTAHLLIGACGEEGDLGLCSGGQLYREQEQGRVRGGGENKPCPRESLLYRAPNERNRVDIRALGQECFLEKWPSGKLCWCSHRKVILNARRAIFLHGATV